MRIVLSGPPSVGKTTQGRLLGAMLGVPHVSSGGIIRERAQAGDHVAQRLLHIVSDGSLAPSEDIIAMVTDRLSQDDCGYGFILDGFPRKSVEAQALLDSDLQIDACLRLCAPADVLLGRVADRARQSAFFRADDDPQIFPRRIAIYEAEISAVMDRFVTAGVPVAEIDASGSAEDICSALGSWLSMQSLVEPDCEAPRLLA